MKKEYGIGKRIFSFILALAMMCTMLPIAAQKVEAASESWLWPVEGIYSMSRGYYATHQGIDITAAGIAGHEVRASKSGTVIESQNNCPHYSSGDDRCNCNGGQGNYVKIQHDDGTYSRYLHLKQGSAHALGRVEQGEPIGNVWSSGDSSGAHLHFDLYNTSNQRINSNPIDSRHTYGGAHDAGNISYIYEINSLIRENLPCYGTLTVTNDKGTAYVKSLPCSQDSDPNSINVEDGPAAYNATYTAIGLCKNKYDNLWYKVQTDSGEIGYMYAGDVSFTQLNDLTFDERAVPETVTQGNVFYLKGTIATEHHKLIRVGAWVEDLGHNVRTGDSDLSVNTKAYKIDGSALDSRAEFDKLPVGTYWYYVGATAQCYYAKTPKEEATKTVTKEWVYQFDVVEKGSTTQKYTVSFEANGGSGAPASITVNAGSTITIPSTAPTYFGHSFRCWRGIVNSNEDFVYPGDSFTVNQNVTFTAQWNEAVMITASCKDYTASVNFPGDASWYKIVPTQEKQRMIFRGWDGLNTGSYFDTVAELYDANGNLLATDDDSGEDNHFYLEYTFEGQQNQEFYLKVRMYDGGTGDFQIIADSPPTLFVSSDLVHLDVQNKPQEQIVFTRSGYMEREYNVRLTKTGTGFTHRWGEWSNGSVPLTIIANGSGSGSITVDLFYTDTEEVLATVIVDVIVENENGYTISFADYIGNGVDGEYTVEEGSAFQIPAEVPTCFGKTFLYWAVNGDPDEGIVYPGGTFYPLSDINFIAYWQNSQVIANDAAAYSVTVNFPNQEYWYRFTPSYSYEQNMIFNSFGETDSRIYLYDENGTLVAQDDDSGVNNNFRLNHLFVDGSDKTFYVKVRMYAGNTGFIPFEVYRGYEVFYDANGGSNAPLREPFLANADAVLSGTIPEREGYVFLGWSRDPEATAAEFSPGSVVTANNTNLTVHAVWMDEDCYAGNHDYVRYVTEPTCMTTGFEEFSCSVCGDHYYGEQYPSLGHDWNESGYCSSCGAYLNEIELESAQTVFIGDPGAYVYFAYTPTISGYYRFESYGDVDTMGFIYDWDTYLICDDDDNGDDRNFSMECWLDSGNTYVLAVRCYGDRTGEFDVLLEYPIELNAPVLTPGEEMDATIDEAGEYVYFAFTPEYNHRYTFTSHSDHDTYGYIYDSEMNQLSYDDDSGEGNNFSVTYTLEAGKTYILGARFYSSGVTGSFSVVLQASHYSSTEGVVTKEPTCTEDGLMTAICEACGVEYMEVIPGGHVWLDDTLSCTRCGGEYYAVGTCGENLRWELDKSGTLTIFGEGEMTDSPWQSWREYIRNVVIAPGVTSICNFAFYNCRNLVSVDMPDGLTSIDDSAFYCCLSLASIDLPDSVSFIGERAFADCDSLVSIDIPESITTIRYGTFEFCDSLTSVNLPDSLTFIGERAFADCDSLASIDIPEGITTIRYSTFESCDSLTSVNLPDSLKKISYSAFAGCSSLRNINLPDGITSIGNSAFIDCYNLTRIEIPAGLTFIDDVLFANCSNLKEVVFKGNAPVITDTAFNNVTANAYYPAGNETWTTDMMQDYGGNITWIAASEDCLAGNHAFTNYIPDGNGTCLADGTKTAQCDYCDATDTIADPDSKTDHRYSHYVYDVNTNTSTAYCDYGCGETKQVEGRPTLAPGVEQPVTIAEEGEIAYFAFTPEYTESYTFYSSGAKDTYGYLYDSSMNQLTSNDDGGDNGNFSLTYTLEAGETYILGARYFSSYATGSFAVVLQTNHSAAEGVVTKESTCTEDGIMACICDVCGTEFTKAIPGGHVWGEDELVCTRCGEEFRVEGSCGENLTWVLDKTGTLTISGEGEMTNSPWRSWREHIRNVVISPGVTSIRHEAFGYCGSLVSVDLPDSLTFIGYYAFDNCTSLTSIDLPDGLTSLEDGVFCGCSSLTSVNLPNSLTSIGYAAFYGCSSLASIALPDSLTSISGRIFYGCTSLTSVDLPDSLTSIGAEAFRDCSSLASINLPAGLTSIGDGAFHNCNNMVSINLPDSVSFIGERAFVNCYRLASVDVPDGITTIRYSTFEGCSSLTSVNLPDSLKKISYSAFAGCSSLASIDLPDGITSIGNSAFIDCYSLTRIEIPAGLTFIDDVLFANCGNLKNIVFKGDAPVISGTAFNNVTANALYPAGNETWTTDVMQDYGGNITWSVMSEDCLAGNHVFTNYISDNNGTCLKDGTMTGRCEICGELDTITEVNSKTDHKFTVAESFHTESHAMSFACEYGCGSTTSVEIPMILINEYNTVTIDDGGEQAYYYYTPEYTDIYSFYAFSDLDTRGYIYDSQMHLLESNDDGFENDYDFQMEYLLEAGKTYILGAEFYKQNQTGSFQVACLPIHEPDEDGIIVIKEPTCTEDGESKYTCNLCGRVITVINVTTGHDWDHNNVCTVCGETLHLEGVCGENLTWVLDQTGTLTISGNGAMDEYAYAADVPWFLNRSEIRSVIIENGVTSIGNYAFMNCDSLICIHLPDSITSIGRCAFYQSERLNDLVIPASVTSIGDYAFEDCTWFRAIIFKGDAPEFGEEVFNSVTADAFYPCDNETWNSDVMQNCGGNITWNEGEFYKEGTCEDGLHWSLDHNGTLTISGEGDMTNDYFAVLTPWYAYKHLCPIEKVVIDQGVTSIGNNAFEFSGFHNSLRRIDIADSVTSIGQYAFLGCKDLETILFAGDAPAFGEGVFSNVNATAYYPAGNPTWTSDVMQDYGGNITWVAYEERELLLGDVNSDGQVNGEDRLALTRYLAKWADYPASVINMDAADVNCDGKVNAQDRLILTRHLAKWTGYETLGA